MPRKKTKSLVRDIQPDRLYNSVQVQKVINRVMLNGKKQIAERLVYGGMQKSADKLKVKNPLDVFEQALKNIQPSLETRSRRSAGLFANKFISLISGFWRELIVFINFIS